MRGRTKGEEVGARFRTGLGIEIDSYGSGWTTRDGDAEVAALWGIILITIIAITVVVYRHFFLHRG